MQTSNSIERAVEHKEKQGYIKTYALNEAAKLLGIGQKKLFKLLRENRIVDSRNLALQSFIDKKLFIVEHKNYIHPRIGTAHYGKTMITGKGLNWIAEQFNLKGVQQ